MNVLLKMVDAIIHATTQLEALSADVTLDTHWPQMVEHAMVSRSLSVLLVNTSLYHMNTEPPSVPRNVRVSSVGQRSATVSWDPPNNTFPNPLTSVSEYRVTASQSQFQEGNRFSTEDEHSGTHQFTDLEEHTMYSFSVAASNIFGYGVASEPEDATTLQAGLLIDKVYPNMLHSGS